MGESGMRTPGLRSTLGRARAFPAVMLRPMKPISRRIPLSTGLTYHVVEWEGNADMTYLSAGVKLKAELAEPDAEPRDNKTKGHNGDARPDPR